MANIIGTQLNGLIESDICALYQSFLYPSSMIARAEVVPPNLNKYAQMLLMSEDPKFIELGSGGEKFDPVYRLFVSHSNPGTLSYSF